MGLHLATLSFAFLLGLASFALATPTPGMPLSSAKSQLQARDDKSCPNIQPKGGSTPNQVSSLSAKSSIGDITDPWIFFPRAIIMASLEGAPLSTPWTTRVIAWLRTISIAPRIAKSGTSFSTGRRSRLPSFRNAEPIRSAPSKQRSR